MWNTKKFIKYRIKCINYLLSLTFSRKPSIFLYHLKPNWLLTLHISLKIIIKCQKITQVQLKFRLLQQKMQKKWSNFSVILSYIVPKWSFILNFIINNNNKLNTCICLVYYYTYIQTLTIILNAKYFTNILQKWNLRRKKTLQMTLFTNFFEFENETSSQ